MGWVDLIWSASMDLATAGLKTTDHDGIIRVDFIERNILDEANIQLISDGLNHVVESAEKPRILICFENVEHLSSAAAGALITVSNRVGSRAGSCVCPTSTIRFWRSSNPKLDQMFQIHGTSAEPCRRSPERTTYPSIDHGILMADSPGHHDDRRIRTDLGPASRSCDVRAELDALQKVVEVIRAGPAA